MVGILSFKPMFLAYAEFLSTNITEFFSIGVLSTYFSPCLYLYLELPQPSCRTLHKALLSILKFTGTHLKPCQGLRGWYVSLNALSLDTRMLCRTASSALQKSKKMMSVFFLIHQLCNPIIEDHHISQSWFTLSEAVLAVTNHLFIFHGLQHSFQEDVLWCVARHRGELTGLQFPWSSIFFIEQGNTCGTS